MSAQGIHLAAIADAIRTREGTTAAIPAGTLAHRILALPCGEEPGGTVLPEAKTQPEQLARIASAIRAKEGSSGAIPASQFAARILALPERKPSRLPKGYTEVEYIQSGGGQYIKTGITADEKSVWKIVMDVEPADTGGCFFGAYRGATLTLQWYFHAYKTAESVDFRMYNAVRTVSFDTSNQRVTICLDRGEGVGKVNELSSDAFPTTTTSVGEIVLLARTNISGAESAKTTIGNKLPAKLYSCQMYKNSDTMARNYVPCISKEGIAGLYDLVEGAFYKSPTSTAFTPGPTV